MRICFVCLGNICRSPAAEAVTAQRAAQRGIEVELDSAGTAAYHVGQPPHEHTLAEAQQRGIPVEHTGWQFGPDDFARFDLVVAMDRSNERDLLAIAPDETARRKVVLLRDFQPGATPGSPEEVIDPWGKKPSAFRTMYDQLIECADGLLDRVADGSVDTVVDAHADARRRH